MLISLSDIAPGLDKSYLSRAWPILWGTGTNIGHLCKSQEKYPASGNLVVNGSRAKCWRGKKSYLLYCGQVQTTPASARSAAT